jgi:hypothetical protein
MVAPNKRNKLAVEDVDEIKEDIRDIRNDIAKMKGDTHSISRIMNLANASKIEDDLVAVVGSSEYKAAILDLTKEEIARPHLAATLGLDPRNLNKFIDPFLDKGYVASIKRGKNLSYRRTESVDLLGIERIDSIRSLIDSWRLRKQSKRSEQSPPTPTVSDGKESQSTTPPDVGQSAITNSSV